MSCSTKLQRLRQDIWITVSMVLARINHIGGHIHDAFNVLLLRFSAEPISIQAMNPTCPNTRSIWMIAITHFGFDLSWKRH